VGRATKEVYSITKEKGRGNNERRGKTKEEVKGKREKSLYSLTVYVKHARFSKQEKGCGYPYRAIAQLV
jgi:hypothetical protein